jgi:hypothetical protein
MNFARLLQSKVGTKMGLVNPNNILEKYKIF